MAAANDDRSFGSSKEETSTTPKENQSKQSVEKESSAEALSAEANFREAIGTIQLPPKGLVEFTAQSAEMQAQRAEGISRAQNVCFLDEQGAKIIGAQYSRSDGTYFKTRAGDTFLVSTDSTGHFILSSLEGSKQYIAVKMVVLPDLLSLKNIESTIKADLAGEKELTNIRKEPIDKEAAKEVVERSVKQLDIVSGGSTPKTIPIEEIKVEEIKAEDIDTESSDQNQQDAGGEEESKENALVNQTPDFDLDDIVEPPSEAKAAETEMPADYDEEAIKERIKKRREERRQRYVIKVKDTLETIASKQLKDVRLANLIFEINKHLIPVKTVRGKQTKQLKVGTAIFLPTPAEIASFREKGSISG